MAPSDLMARAVIEVPFDATEAELLSGGIPRGFKALTTATSKLVKAGWLVKGRTGWTATEEGVRAVRAFDDADQFVNAMLSGAPIPEHSEAHVHAPASPEQLGEEMSAAPSMTFDDVPAAGTSDLADRLSSSPLDDPTPPDVTPTIDAVSDSAATSTAPEVWEGQPQSVELSGDFDPLFGEAGHWSTGLRELQLDYDAAAADWTRTLHLPAGTYQYKIVVNGSWEENYGRFGVRDGDNHELHLLSDTAVTIRFDYSTKDITTS